MALELWYLKTTWALCVLVPVLFAVASWALQMACAFCAVEPPVYRHAVWIVIVLSVANVGLHYSLAMTASSDGIWMQYMAPLLVSGVVIALTVPTPLLSAIGVAAIHLLFCGILCAGLQGLVHIVTRAAASAI